MRHSAKEVASAYPGFSSLAGQGQTGGWLGDSSPRARCGWCCFETPSQREATGLQARPQGGSGCCGDHGESGSGGAEDARRSGPGRECAGKAWQHNLAGAVAHQPRGGRRTTPFRTGRPGITRVRRMASESDRRRPGHAQHTEHHSRRFGDVGPRRPSLTRAVKRSPAAIRRTCSLGRMQST
jgi:hypothetical protein